MSQYGRITGLASGLDTDNLIKQILKAEKIKIDKVKSQQTLDTWRQEKYREVSSLLLGLKSEYMDILKADSNLRSPKSFNVFTPNVKVKGKDSDKVSIKVNGSLPQPLKIGSIDRLASAHKISSKVRAKEMSTLTLDQAAIDKINAAIDSGKNTLKFNIDGTERSITLTKKTYTDATDLANEINVKISDTFGAGTGVVKADGNKIKFDFVGHSVNFTGEETELTKTLGLDKKSSNMISKQTTLKELGISSKVHNYVSEITIGSTKLQKLNDIINSDKLSIKFKLGDNAGQIDITKKNYASLSELADEINQKLSAQYSDGSLKVSVDGDKLKFVAKDKELSFVGEDGDIITELGLKGKKAQLDPESLNMKLMINGSEIKVKETDSVAQFINKVNSSGAEVKMAYDEITGKFELIAEKTGFVNRIKFDDAHTNAVFEKFGLANGAQEESGGEDALVTINGISMTSASNTINKNGLSITLNQLHSAADGDIEVNYSKNTDEIVKKMKGFVEKYNDIVGKLTKLTVEKREYKYTPLSDEMKKEMDKDDIKKWEERAKSGLLKNDIYIERVLSNMRSAFVDKVGDSDLSAHKIGLKLTSNHREGGKIIFDEATFRKSLEENPAGVTKFFTDVSEINYRDRDKSRERYKTGGLMQRISDVIEDATRTVSINGKKGYFVEKAGIKGTASESLNDISKKIKEYDNKIENMFQAMYKKEERLYKQFAQLERLMQKANSQSARLAGLLGGK